MRSFVVSPGFSTTTRTSYGQEGWSLYGTAEFADKRYGGDFTFSQLTADIRRYQPLSRYDNINIRLRAGTSGGKLPADLAGPGNHFRISEKANQLPTLGVGDYLVVRGTDEELLEFIDQP